MEKRKSYPMNKRLKGAIIAKYGTQYKFARDLETQETVISDVIRGRRKLDSDTQKKWAKMLEHKPKDIFSV